MGLQDRLTRQGEGGDNVVALTTSGAHRSAAPVANLIIDPYADLKARIHHQCIAKLGPELYKQDSDDLADRVYKAVTEELTLDRTSQAPSARCCRSNILAPSATAASASADRPNSASASASIAETFSATSSGRSSESPRNVRAISSAGVGDPLTINA